ncbi:hypothetical protein ADUPG1_013707, partial [Aduncisulcus paluster]
MSDGQKSSVRDFDIDTFNQDLESFTKLVQDQLPKAETRADVHLDLGEGKQTIVSSYRYSKSDKNPPLDTSSSDKFPSTSKFDLLEIASGKTEIYQGTKDSPPVDKSSEPVSTDKKPSYLDTLSLHTDSSKDPAHPPRIKHISSTSSISSMSDDSEGMYTIPEDRTYHSTAFQQFSSIPKENSFETTQKQHDSSQSLLKCSVSNAQPNLISITPQVPFHPTSPGGYTTHISHISEPNATSPEEPCRKKPDDDSYATNPSENPSFLSEQKVETDQQVTVQPQRPSTDFSSVKIPPVQSFEQQTSQQHPSYPPTTNPPVVTQPSSFSQHPDRVDSDFLTSVFMSHPYLIPIPPPPQCESSLYPLLLRAVICMGIGKRVEPSRDSKDGVSISSVIPPNLSKPASSGSSIAFSLSSVKPPTHLSLATSPLPSPLVGGLLS